MGKNRTKSGRSEEKFASRRSASTPKLGHPWGELSPRAGLFDVVLHMGFEGVLELLEADREALCGPRRRWQADRSAYRYGFDEGRLVYGGRTVKVTKPRVRSVDGRELELPTWRRFAEEDPLQDRVLRQILAGVTSRKYAGSLDAMPEGMAPGLVSASSVSRQFIAVTQRRMREFLSRPVGALDIVAVLVDGTVLGETTLVVALGIDRDGKKHVLGVVEGTTESEATCRSLLRDLIERGLPVERCRLWVIDGGKGLRKAIRTTFGDWALIQRCHVHKLRNVLDHLPKNKHAWVRAAIRKAWGLAKESEAKRKLLDLAGQLESDHPGAAGSLREGLDDTLTLIRLGVKPGALHRTLCSTNPIENLIGGTKGIARNVKRWRGGRMILRWSVTGLIEAEKKFRRIRGHNDLPLLIAALDASKAMDTEQAVA
jgi:putative transposase